MIVLISGNKRSGKDYIAELLSEKAKKDGIITGIFHFADYLKQIIASTFNISRDELDHYKNHPEIFKLKLSSVSKDMSYEIDFRKILQRFGTEGMKPIFGEDIWARLLIDNIKVNNYDLILIPDFRFPEEFYYIKNNTHHRVLHVKVLGGESGDNHLSETALRDRGLFPDYVVDNRGRSPYADVENVYKYIKEGLLNENI